MTYKIHISEAEFDALPENQRFLLEQLMVAHPGPQHVTPKFNPVQGDTGVANERELDAARNGLGGVSKPFDPNRRFQ